MRNGITSVKDSTISYILIQEQLVRASICHSRKNFERENILTYTLLCIFAVKIQVIMETIVLNQHNKQEYEPAHTAEHLLNATMVKMFGCPRSRNAHVEKKKSKCDYILDAEPSAEQVAQIETEVNGAIVAGLDVTVEFVSREKAAEIVDLSKLPEDASQMLRIVRIGDYDVCACIGAHVANTAEIGSFKIISHSYADGVWRLRWKVMVK